MGSGISNQSPESIKTLLRNIASNKDLGQDQIPIGTIASNKDLELAIAKAALGGPTVLNPYLSFFEIDWRPFEIDCRPFRKRDLHTYREDLQRYIDSRPFIKLAKGDGSNRPSFDQIGQLTTVANFSNTFRWFYKRKNGLVNLDLLDARTKLENPLALRAADDILNVAAYSNLGTFGVDLSKELAKSTKEAQPIARSPEECQPEEYIVFHHYTSPDCIKAIKESEKIIQSTAFGSTVYGCGVYGTPLCPENGRKRIAKNNYADGWRLNEKDGKVEAVFRIKLKKNQRVKQIVDTDRQIYLYDGDLEFKDAEEVDLIYYTGIKRRVENLKMKHNTELFKIS